MTGTRFGCARLALALLVAASGCNDDAGGSSKAASDASLGDAGAMTADGAAGTAQISLAVGEAKKAMIGVEGGTIVLENEKFSLEVPKDALKQATEITVRPLKSGEHLFAVELEPSGLVFDKAATGRILVEQVSAQEKWVTPVLFDDSGKPEPVKQVALEKDAGEAAGFHKVRFDVPHFSILVLYQGLAPSSGQSIVENESLAPALPWSLPVGVIFNAPYRANLIGEMVQTTFCQQGGSETCTPFTTDAQVIAAATIFEHEVSGAVREAPQINDISPRAFGRNTPATVFPGFACRQAGSGSASVEPVTHLTVRAVLPNLRILDKGHAGLTARWVEGGQAQADFEAVQIHDAYDYDPITCTDGGSIVGAMALTDPDVLTLIALAKGGWMGGCVLHSNGQACQVPGLGTWLYSVTDPVLQLGPNGAARFESAFPCGEGPVGTTLCASGNAFSEGDWVYVAATVAEDLVLDDSTGSYQLAFVFDADGNANNNYVPAPQYPNDFFQGTDKWYQALYTPGSGWELQVSDQRLGGGQVVSDARFILAGRQLALLLPRSELDGSSPRFRVTAFRHEGDYGLSGGPWSASYAPALNEPLFPAASGTPIVVPE